MTRGIITYGYGKPRYLEMAKTLARSLDIQQAGQQVKIPRAVVTDSDDPELAELFDSVIPLDRSRGGDVLQKLWLYEYSPYEQTLFIDSDSLVVGSVEWLWEFFASVSFGVIGSQRATIPHYFERARLPAHLQFDTYPVFNGGVYYFVKGQTAKAVFEDAKTIAANYREWGLCSYRDVVGDEPCISLALAKNGLTAMADHEKRTMYTPVGIVGPLKIDVLQGFCRFNKSGEHVKPVIVHFPHYFSSGPIYRRECFKINLYRQQKMAGPQISALANAMFIPMQIATFLHQTAANGKRALKGLPRQAKV